MTKDDCSGSKIDFVDFESRVPDNRDNEHGFRADSGMARQAREDVYATYT